ncbi:hypothetical protein ACFL6D_01575 [Spirochaetota bacterium]
MKNILFIIFAACTVFASSKEVKKVTYYNTIVMYPLPNLHMQDFLTAKSFNGYSETELLNLIQKNYFYIIPEMKGRLKSRRTGAITVTEYIGGSQVKYIQKKIIKQEDTDMSIILQYALKSGKAELVKKYILHKSSIVDSVDYVYAKNTLIYAKSLLYGIKYFTKPSGVIERIKRNFYTWLYK